LVRCASDAGGGATALGPRRTEEIALQIALLGGQGLDTADPAPRNQVPAT